jgi:hypothetical protein
MGQCAAQVSLFDLRDAQGEPCLPEAYEVRHDARSVRTLVDALGGTQRSGQQRARMQAEVNEALWRLYIHAWAVLESELLAAAVLLRVCARDRVGLELPEWLVALWEEYRPPLAEMYRREYVGCETDYSEGQASE